MWSQCSHAVFPLSDPFRIGKYSVKGTIYDPLNLASTYDNNWLREAEIKHGRVCMLAFAGYVANDAGIKFPGKAFEGLSSIEAHDAMVQSGAPDSEPIFSSDPLRTHAHTQLALSSDPRSASY